MAVQQVVRMVVVVVPADVVADVIMHVAVLVLLDAEPVVLTTAVALVLLDVVADVLTDATDVQDVQEAAMEVVVDAHQAVLVVVGHHVAMGVLLYVEVQDEWKSG